MADLMIYRTVILATLALGACASPKDIYSLTPAPNQEAMVRDGVPALVSSKRNVVFLRPVAPRQDSYERPRFVVAVLNKGKTPVNFNVADVNVTSSRPRVTKIKVYTYTELVDEAEVKRNTQLTLAVLSGAAGAISAANAGNSYTTGTFANHTPYGGSYGSYSASTYNPGLQQVAINANTDRTINNMAAAEGQAQNVLAQLQETIIKDHTLMPGEWHGGVIVLGNPEKGDNGADYQISLQFEEHTFTLNQRSNG